MRMPHSLVLALLLAAPACAPDIAYLGTEVSEVCVRDVPVLFDGQQNGVASARVPLAQTGMNLYDMAGATLTLDSIVLTAGPEIEDFSFAQRIQVDLTASPRDAGLALVDMQSVEPAHSLYMGGDPDVDLTDHLLAQDAGVDIVLVGTPPNTSFSASIDICLAVDGLDDSGAI